MSQLNNDVPASRKLIAGANITINGGAEATLESDVTIAAAGGGASGIDVEDETLPVLAGATTLNFTGAGVSASNAGGGVVDVSIPGGGGVSGVDVEDETLPVLAGATTLNFTGAGVTASNAGGGVVDVSIPGGGGGSAWDFDPPLAANFTTYNGDANSVVLTDDADVGLILDNGTPVAGNIQRIATTALPGGGAGDFIATAKLRLNGSNLVGSQGFVLHESATGKMILFGNLTRSAFYAWYGTLTSFVAAIINYVSYDRFVWLRFRYVSGSNTYFLEYSSDGKSWLTEASIVATTPFTVRADRVGFGFQNAGANATKFPKISCPYFTIV